MAQAQMRTLGAAGADDDDDVIRDGDIFIVEIDGEDVKYPASMYQAHKNADKKGILQTIAPLGTDTRKAYEAVKAAKAAGTIQNQNKSAAPAKVTVNSPLAVLRPPSTTTPSSRSPSMNNSPSGYLWAGRATASGTTVTITVKPERDVTIRGVVLGGSDTGAEVTKVELGMTPIMIPSTESADQAVAPKVSDFIATAVRNPWLAGHEFGANNPLKITIKGATTGNVTVNVETDPFPTTTCKS